MLWSSACAHLAILVVPLAHQWSAGRPSTVRYVDPNHWHLTGYWSQLETPCYDNKDQGSLQVTVLPPLQQGQQKSWLIMDRIERYFAYHLQDYHQGNHDPLCLVSILKNSQWANNHLPSPCSSLSSLLCSSRSTLASQSKNCLTSPGILEICFMVRHWVEDSGFVVCCI